MERFEHAYRTELAVFVETVLRGGESACSLHEARAALLVATAADLSRTSIAPYRSRRWLARRPSQVENRHLGTRSDPDKGDGHTMNDEVLETIDETRSRAVGSS